MQLIREIKEITDNRIKQGLDPKAYRWIGGIVVMTKENQFKNNFKSDGVDEEFSRELADQDDLEAQARAEAANQRVKQKNK